jgi:hypothetical protein
MPDIKFEQSNQERIPSPENASEQRIERVVDLPQVNRQEPDLPVLPAVDNSSQSPTKPIEPYRDPRVIQIESILQEDLDKLFLDLPDGAKLVFKTEGELTAKKINALLSETKVAVQKIVDLIKAWLSLLGGVNKFFVEQEAKIKADNIMLVKQNYE